jgi:hypothetical protein
VPFFIAMDGVYAENAGAFFGGAWMARKCRKRSSIFRRVPGWPELPKPKQHFSAAALDGPKCRKTKEKFPAADVRLPARRAIGYARRSHRTK